MTPAAILTLWSASCAWWAAWLRVGLVLMGDAPGPRLEPEVLAAMGRQAGERLG